MLSFARILFYLGLAIPFVAFIVDRYFLCPRLGAVMFALACVGTYSFLIAAVISTQVEIASAEERRANGTLNMTSEQIDAIAPVADWRSERARNLALLSLLLQVPCWSAVAYFALWVLHLPVAIWQRLTQSPLTRD